MHICDHLARTELLSTRLHLLQHPLLLRRSTNLILTCNSVSPVMTSERHKLSKHTSTLQTTILCDSDIPKEHKLHLTSVGYSLFTKARMAHAHPTQGCDKMLTSPRTVHKPLPETSYSLALLPTNIGVCESTQDTTYASICICVHMRSNCMLGGGGHRKRLSTRQTPDHK